MFFFIKLLCISCFDFVFICDGDKFGIVNGIDIVFDIGDIGGWVFDVCFIIGIGWVGFVIVKLVVWVFSWWVNLVCCCIVWNWVSW